MTPTEAAIIAAFYSLIIGLLAYRDLTWRDIPKVILQTCETTGVVLSLVMTAGIFGYALSVAQIPQQMTAILLAFAENKILLLIIVNIFLLFVGMFMESNAAILILTPILIPAMMSAGVDQTQACMIMILNLMIGVITPPVGVVLYVVSNVSKVPFEKVMKATLPFLVPLGIVLLLVTFVPAVSLWLPNLLMGTA